MVTFIGFVAGNILCAFHCLHVQSHDTHAAYVALAFISIVMKMECLMLSTRFFIMQLLSSSLLSSFKLALVRNRGCSNRRVFIPVFRSRGEKHEACDMAFVFIHDHPYGN